MTPGNTQQPADGESRVSSATPPAHTPAPEPLSVESIPQNLLDRIRRHHVGRIALLYLGISWVILDPIHVVFHMLAVPEWVSRTVVIAMALGFPLVVVPAWIYSLKAARPDAGPLDVRHHHRINRRLNYAIGAVAVLMLTYFLLYYFWLGKHFIEPIHEGARESAEAEGAPGVAVPQRSIAVLPFVDMSQARDQQYLADGLAEELLNRLAQIPELRVAARTSSFAFKDKPEDISSIAQQLRVAHVLEGSVRKAGDHVRITAQLNRADSGYHLWSESYDRQLGDIFKLQEEIAAAVVEALKVKLLEGDLPPRPAPANIDAYNLYLQGRFVAGQHNKQGYMDAIAYLERAVKLDPSFEPSWTQLSIVYGEMAARGFMPAAEALSKAREAVGTALSLNGKSARAHVALGYLHMNDDWDWAAADREFARALALEPGSADVLHAAGSLDLVLGRSADAVTRLHAALARDPVRASSYANLGVAYFAAGRLPEAEQAFRKAIELRPTALYNHSALGLVLLWQGNTSAALEEMRKESDERWRLGGLAIVYSAMHRREEMEAALAELKARFQNESPYIIATVYGYRGEADQAFLWLDRALAARDATLTSIKSDPLFQKVRSDARYAALLQKLGLPP